jgi:hypothetical protein
MENSYFAQAAGHYHDEIHNLATQTGFLGREFLTWLWHFSESDGRFELKKEPKAPGQKSTTKGHVAVHDRLSLMAAQGLSLSHVIKGGQPSQCQEAGIALRDGKSVQELRLKLTLNETEIYYFSLSANDLNPRSVELPAMQEVTDEAPIEQRIGYFSALSSCIDLLMSKFMNERANMSWESEQLQSIRKWIKTREKDRGGNVH